MDEFARQAFLEWESNKVARQRVFWVHVILWTMVNLMLFVIWLVTGAGFPWFVFPALGWGVGLAAHGAGVFVLRGPDDVIYQREARRRRLES